jgi:hypothetical protein
MVDKPRGLAAPLAGQAGMRGRYFFLRGFAFFFTSSVRSLCGMVSMRRASSSSDIGGELSALRLVVVMGGV